MPKTRAILRRSCRVMKTKPYSPRETQHWPEPWHSKRTPSCHHWGFSLFVTTLVTTDFPMPQRVAKENDDFKPDDLNLPRFFGRFGGHGDQQHQDLRPPGFSGLSAETEQ